MGKKNLFLTSIIMIIMLCLSITALSLYNLRTSGIKSAIQNAESISEVIKSGLTSHMVNDNMHEVSTFIQSVSNLKDVKELWLVRSELLNNQFQKESYNTPKDEIDKEVIQTGELKYQIDESFTKTFVRVTIPYNAIADKGIDCLKCHNVKQGDTLGAVSLVLDISSLKELGLESLYIIIGLIITTLILFIFLSRKILNPYFTLFNIFKKNINQA